MEEQEVPSARPLGPKKPKRPATRMQLSVAAFDASSAGGVPLYAERDRFYRLLSRAQRGKSARTMVASTKTLVVALYVVHTVLELVLGGIKLRGTYSGMTMPPGAERFARHHGVSLLALALLGGLALRGRSSQPPHDRLCHTDTGAVVSTALAFFHAGAVLVMLHALLTTGAGLNVVLLHTPFAVAFTWHARINKANNSKFDPNDKRTW